jgi:hypothetical protein
VFLVTDTVQMIGQQQEVSAMTQESFRDLARRLNGLARATSDKELRGRYLEEALMLVQEAEELDYISSGPAIKESPAG